MTNYEKPRFRVGSSDPTHWREDELQTPSVNLGRGRKNVKPTKWAWHNKLLLCALLFVSIFKIYQYSQQQPEPQQLQPHRLPVAPQPLPVPTSEPAPELQALELQRQRDADDRHRLELFRHEQAKAQAWEKFYQPSAFCREHATVECANLYIRARRAFDAQWPPT